MRPELSEAAGLGQKMAAARRKFAELAVGFSRMDGPFFAPPTGAAFSGGKVVNKKLSLPSNPEFRAVFVLSICFGLVGLDRFIINPRSRLSRKSFICYDAQGILFAAE